MINLIIGSSGLEARHKKCKEISNDGKCILRFFTQRFFNSLLLTNKMLALFTALVKCWKLIGVRGR